MAKASRSIVPNRRVQDILSLLERSPLPAHLILKASSTFGTVEEPDAGFTDIRRVRGRLQQLAEAGLVVLREYALTGHGVMNFDHLSTEGYRLLHQADPPAGGRAFFREVAVTRREHCLALAKVIVHTLVGADRRKIPLVGFKRENTFPIEVAGRMQKPDSMWQFEAGGRLFNNLVEVDMGTEAVDALSANSIKNKIDLYEAYYDMASRAWKAGDRRGRRPRLRVVFFTSGIQRAHNILSLARRLAGNQDRLLCYAITTDSYLGEDDPLCASIFLDHHGRWQSLVDVFPSSGYLRSGVRLSEQTLEAGLGL